MTHLGFERRVFAQEGCGHREHIAAGGELLHREDHIVLDVCCTREAYLQGSDDTNCGQCRTAVSDVVPSPSNWVLKSS